MTARYEIFFRATRGPDSRKGHPATKGVTHPSHVEFVLETDPETTHFEPMTSVAKIIDHQANAATDQHYVKDNLTAAKDGPFDNKDQAIAAARGRNLEYGPGSRYVVVDAEGKRAEL